MTQPWWRGAIIYQVYPRSFLDTDGDGVGDLAGIAARLDYIAALGVDAVWISPFFKSPMRDFGYDVADYREVDPLFGTNEDFRTILKGAHERGLKVMIDMVLAHTSEEHPWFKESRSSRDNPKAAWYVWADAKPDGAPPNNWQSVFGGPSWQWDTRRHQYYLHHFLKSQPNLDWHNPEVVEAMLEEVRFWLEHGVDGLRLDAITTLMHDPQLRDNPPAAKDTARDIGVTLLSPFTMQEHVHDRDHADMLKIFGRLRALTDRYPDHFTMGEIGDVDTITAIAKYTQGTDRLHSGYTFQLTRPEFGAGRLVSVIARKEEALGDGWPTWSFGNHDTSRIVSRWGGLPRLSGDPDALARLLMACLLTLRGSVCIYQGEELGLTQADIPFEQLVDPWGIEFWPHYKGRDGCRTPMPWRGDAPHGGFTTGTPWLPVPQDHLARAVDRQEKDPASVLAAYRRFIAWRKGEPALRTGSIHLLALPDPAFGLVREGDGRRVLCAFNLSNAPVETALEGGWAPLDGHGFNGARLADGRLRLPAFGAFFAAGA
jgi:alpha-glucosidase